MCNKLSGLYLICLGGEAIGFLMILNVEANRTFALTFRVCNSLFVFYKNMHQH